MQSPARLLKLTVFGVALVIDGILVALVLIYLTGQAFQVPLVAFLVLFLLLMLYAFASQRSQRHMARRSWLWGDRGRFSRRNEEAYLKEETARELRGEGAEEQWRQ